MASVSIKKSEKKMGQSEKEHSSLGWSVEGMDALITINLEFIQECRIILNGSRIMLAKNNVNKKYRAVVAYVLEQ